MGALSFVLPFTIFVYLLPSVPTIADLGKVATTVAEQFNNLIGVIGVPNQVHPDNTRQIELEQKFSGDVFGPLGITGKPVISSVSDAAKLNLGFQAKVLESKNLPLIPDAGFSTDVHFDNQAKWSQWFVSSDGRKSLKESATEEERAERPGASKDVTIEGNKRDATLSLHIPDIKDTLTEKFAKASMQVGLDVGIASKTNTSTVDNRVKKKKNYNNKKNYIQLCRRLTGGPKGSLMQKLHGKDCVKLPGSEFYLEQSAKDAKRRDGTARLVGLQIRAKTNNGEDSKDSKNESNEYKQRHGASISDGSANYDESTLKVADKLTGTDLNIKTSVIDDGNLLRDSKLSLSTALKV